MVFLGNVSNKAMMNTDRGILSVRGTWGEYRLGERKVPAMPTLHPAYLLRNPAHKRLAWQDFLEIRAKLEELGRDILKRRRRRRIRARRGLGFPRIIP